MYEVLGFVLKSWENFQNSKNLTVCSGLSSNFLSNQNVEKRTGIPQCSGAPVYCMDNRHQRILWARKRCTPEAVHIISSIYII